MGIMEKMETTIMGLYRDITPNTNGDSNGKENGK